MLANGYRPLSIHSAYSQHAAPDRRGKQPLTEVVNGVKKSWSDGHSERRLMRVTVDSANTGTLLGGSTAQVALDIDPSKTATAADQVSFTLDLLQLIYAKCPELKAALLRRRDPASVLLLCRASRAMTKRVVAGERGKLELLGEGQQCLVDGWHPLSRAGLPVKWEWHRDRAPWKVPVVELPVIPDVALIALMDRIRDSGLLGPPVARRTTTTTIVSRGRRATMYPATARLNELLAQHNDLVKPAVRALIEEVGQAGQGRHDAIVAICGRLVGLRWSDDQVTKFLEPLVDQHFWQKDVEVERALSHARKREKEHLAKVKTLVWGNSSV